MQKLITGYDWLDFQLSVNKLMEAGWRVLPGTLTVSVCAPSSTAVDERWAVVLEKSLTVKEAKALQEGKL